MIRGAYDAGPVAGGASPSPGFGGAPSAGVTAVVVAARWLRLPATFEPGPELAAQSAGRSPEVEVSELDRRLRALSEALVAVQDAIDRFRERLR